MGIIRGVTYPQVAILEAAQLLKKDPDNFVSLFYSGFSHSVLGNIDTAKTYFKKCVQLRPNYVPARQYLANMYSLQDSAELSREQYLIVIAQSDSLFQIGHGS